MMPREKELVLRSAVDILAQCVLAFGQEGRYEEIKTAVTRAISEAPTVEDRALMTCAADAVEEVLEKAGIDAAPIARTFLAMMKRDMGME